MSNQIAAYKEDNGMDYAGEKVSRNCDLGYTAAGSHAIWEINRVIRGGETYIEVIGSGINEGSILYTIAKNLGVDFTIAKESGISGATNAREGIGRFKTSNLNNVAYALAEKKLISEHMRAFIAEQASLTNGGLQQAVTKLSKRMQNEPRLFNSVGDAGPSRKAIQKLGAYISLHAEEITSILEGNKGTPGLLSNPLSDAVETLTILRGRERQRNGAHVPIQLVDVQDSKLQQPLHEGQKRGEDEVLRRCFRAVITEQGRGAG